VALVGRTSKIDLYQSTDAYKKPTYRPNTSYRGANRFQKNRLINPASAGYHLDASYPKHVECAPACPRTVH